MPTYCMAPVFGLGAQLFTNQGVILAGGKVYTYLAGSTTPATTYTDSLGTVPNSNPIVLDSAGRLTSPIWVTAGAAYKFVLTDSTGATVGMTLDNVRGVNDLTVSAPPASCATLSANRTGSGSYEPLIFQSILLNNGSGYNATTGIFTAPTTGTYIVSLTLNVVPSGSVDVYAYVGNQYVKQYVASGTAQELSLCYVTSLAAGATLYAGVLAASGTLQVTAAPNGGPSRGSTLSIALISAG